MPPYADVSPFAAADYASRRLFAIIFRQRHCHYYYATTPFLSPFSCCFRAYATRTVRSAICLFSDIDITPLPLIFSATYFTPFHYAAIIISFDTLILLPPAATLRAVRCSFHYASLSLLLMPMPLLLFTLYDMPCYALMNVFADAVRYASFAADISLFDIATLRLRLPILFHDCRHTLITAMMLLSLLHYHAALRLQRQHNTN